MDEVELKEKFSRLLQAVKDAGNAASFHNDMLKDIFKADLRDLPRQTLKDFALSMGIRRILLTDITNKTADCPFAEADLCKRENGVCPPCKYALGCTIWRTVTLALVLAWNVIEAAYYAAREILDGEKRMEAGS